MYTQLVIGKNLGFRVDFEVGSKVDFKVIFPVAFKQ